MTRRDDRKARSKPVRIIVFGGVIVLLILATLKSYRMKVQRLDRQNTMFFKIVDNLQTVNPTLVNTEKHIEDITESLQKNVDEKALI